MGPEFQRRAHKVLIRRIRFLPARKLQFKHFTEIKVISKIIDFFVKLSHTQVMVQDTRSMMHYYGDSVRKIFVGAAVIMLLFLPFYTDRIPFSYSASIFTIVFLGVIAGVTNPLQKWVIVLNTLISAGGVAVFEYMAINNYEFLSLFFWINQLLAVLFLIALYFNTKTFRGMVLKD